MEFLDGIAKIIDYVSEKAPLICHLAGLMTQVIMADTVQTYK